MTPERLLERFATLAHVDLPAPGSGGTEFRHSRIFDAGCEDLSLAKLIEAHWDAVAILLEAGRKRAADAKYAVWASEMRGQALHLTETDASWTITGTKPFCSGAGLVDRALVTAGEGGSCLVEIDMNAAPGRVEVDRGGWQVDAFRMTQTATLTFKDYPVLEIVGRDNWYVERPGFWMGACGPAAAWAGGAAGLVDYVMASKRDDPHTLAHLAAMHADVWSTQTCLRAAAEEFDSMPSAHAIVRALEVRHLVEQACTDVLRRFTRAMGPAPLAKDAEIARRYAELDLFLRQSHAERDLESLGRVLRRRSLSMA